MSLLIGIIIGAAAGYYVGYKRPGAVLLQLAAFASKIMAKVKSK